MFPYLFICFLLISCVVVYHQAVVSVSVCSSIEGVHRLGVVADTGLFGYCTVKGPVLLCLERHTTHTDQWADKYNTIQYNTLSHRLWEFVSNTDCYTCLMAVSPTLSECFLMLSRKSLRSDMEISLISSLSLGRFSAMIWQNLYWLTLQETQHNQSRSVHFQNCYLI